MNRLIRKKHENIQGKINKYETAHEYREPEEVELTDREHIMKLYEMLADQQKQIDMLKEMIGSKDPDNGDR